MTCMLKQSDRGVIQLCGHAAAGPSSSPRQLLSLMGAAPLLELMAAGAALQLHLPLLQRFLDFLQVGRRCISLCLAG
jgi:hypothetical protein